MIKLTQLLLEADDIEFPPGWGMMGMDPEDFPDLPDEVRVVRDAIYEELKNSGVGNPKALIKVSFTGEDGNRWLISTVAKWSKIPADNRMWLMYYDERPDEELTGWYMNGSNGEKLNEKQLQYCVKNWRKLSIGR